MKIFLSIFTSLFVISCVSVSNAPLDKSELIAIGSAEQFVERNGYTTKGHPANLIVNYAEVLDSLMSKEELVLTRKGTISSKAFGLSKLTDNSFYVLFHSLNDWYEFRAVLVQGGIAVQVVHASLQLSKMTWKKGE